MKSEFAKKWDAWKDSEEGKKCSDRTTLTNITDQYLINRLHGAFSAGWNGKEQLSQVEKPTTPQPKDYFLAIVEVNSTSKYYSDWVGVNAQVIGIKMEKDEKINITVIADGCEYDGFEPSELDIIV